MSIIEIYNTHCCGEIGDVIVSGDIKIDGKTILEQSKYLFDNKKLRNFVLNEPRGGVFKHCNLIVSPKNKESSIKIIFLIPDFIPGWFLKSWFGNMTKTDDWDINKSIF